MSSEEQQPTREVEQFAKDLFNDDETWPVMSSVTRQDWIQRAERMFAKYSIERKPIQEIGL